MSKPIGWRAPTERQTPVMKITQIQDIVKGTTSKGRSENWDVVADDGAHTIQAPLGTAVTLEALGVPIEASPTPEHLATLRRWRDAGIGTD